MKHKKFGTKSIIANGNTTRWDDEWTIDFFINGKKIKPGKWYHIAVTLKRPKPGGSKEKKK